MHVEVDHNLTRHELTRSIAGLAIAEDIGEPLIKAIGAASESREPTPEAWMTGLQREWIQQAGRLDGLMLTSVTRLIGDWTGLRLKKARGARAALWLSQAQIEELLSLIRAHYRVAIRAGGAGDWGGAIPPATVERWKKLGILAPSVRFDGLLGDAFVAGRLMQVLDDGASLADMRKLAASKPLARSAELARNAVVERTGFDLRGGPGYRAEQIAGRLVLNQNAQAVQDIIGQYRDGKLRHTPTNREGLSPAEMDAAATDRVVEGWRGLGRELRNRMAATDRARDWERVAASSLRMTANIGRITEMAEQGATELYYMVHPSACQHCKKLYLEKDGTPKIFPIGELLENVSATGGANYDRLASKIGDPERGWLPNALAHPWCQCRPMQRVKNAPLVTRTPRK